VESYGPANTEGLHSARKNLKRSRSLLRLLRQVEFKPLRKSLNKALRGTARSLSLDRDREVLVALAAQWADPAKNPSNAALSAACRKLTASLLSGEPSTIGIDAKLKKQVLSQLAETGAAINKATLPGLAVQDLRRAAAKTYRRLRGDFDSFIELPGFTELHDLRKSAKDHLYHRQLLADLLSLQPERTEAIRGFEGMLGDIRDCDLLMETIDAAHRHGLTLRQVATLKRKARMEKAALLEKALHMGQDLLGLDQSDALSK